MLTKLHIGEKVEIKKQIPLNQTRQAQEIMKQTVENNALLKTASVDQRAEYLRRLYVRS